MPAITSDNTTAVHGTVWALYSSRMQKCHRPRHLRYVSAGTTYTEVRRDKAIPMSTCSMIGMAEEFNREEAEQRGIFDAQP